MLREEVASRTPLGREVSDIMARGDLVSSAVVTALMRRRMRRHPGRRILLDGFPRSLENARDFVELCGPPELALHLNCDDTVMIERILSRGAGTSAGSSSGGDVVDATSSSSDVVVRSDDNVHTAIQRLKNYHKHHGPTMSWLKEIRVPIVELDCSGTREDVWGQLTAIGRLMRPAVRLPLQQQQKMAQAQSNDDVVSARQPRSQPPMQEVMYGGVVGEKSYVEEDVQWIA
jgi:adenylate kinase